MSTLNYSMATVLRGIVSAICWASPALATTPNGYVSTGGGFADIDRDGWPDFVAANGNDISRQHLTVYLNAGNGTFPRQLEPAVGGHRVQRAPGPGRRER